MFKKILLIFSLGGFASKTMSMLPAPSCSDRGIGAASRVASGGGVAAVCMPEEVSAECDLGDDLGVQDVSSTPPLFSLNDIKDGIDRIFGSVACLEHAFLVIIDDFETKSCTQKKDPDELKLSLLKNLLALFERYSKPIKNPSGKKAPDFKAFFGNKASFETRSLVLFAALNKLYDFLPALIFPLINIFYEEIIIPHYQGPLLAGPLRCAIEKFDSIRVLSGLSKRATIVAPARFCFPKKRKTRKKKEGAVGCPSPATPDSTSSVEICGDVVREEVVWPIFSSPPECSGLCFIGGVIPGHTCPAFASDSEPDSE